MTFLHLTIGMKKTVNMTTEMHRKLPLRCEKSKKNYEEELPRSLPRHLSPHPTLHLIPHPSVYTIAENSTQDVSKCTVFRSEVKKIFWGERALVSRRVGEHRRHQPSRAVITNSLSLHEYPTVDLWPGKSLN